MNNLKFYINKQIIDRFKQESVSTDYIGSVIIILLCLYEKNTELLNEVDDNNKSRRLLLLYRYLVRRSLIETPEEEDENIYQLTEKGVNLTKFILSFGDDEVEVRKEMLHEVLETEEKVEDWIQEWVELFPPEKIFGRSLRTNHKDCLDRMKWFKSQFDFSKKQIFAATKEYLEGQRTSPDGYKFTRNSTYFISKGKGAAERTSDLATACENLNNTSTNKYAFNRDSI